MVRGKPAEQRPFAAIRADLADLQARVQALDAAVQGNRRLHRKIAELTDVVEQLVVAPQARDEKTFEQALTDYLAGL